MEFKEYVRMLRRGWPAIALVVFAFLGLGGAYLTVAPKHFVANTTLLLTPAVPRTLYELQQGNQVAQDSVKTYAQLVDSATVLGPAAASLRPQLESANDLESMVTVTVPTDSTLIDVSVDGSDRERVALVANAVASSAAEVLPATQTTRSGTPMLRIAQTRQAVEPVAAVSPDPKRILAIALVVGLAIGVGVVIAVQTLDTKVRSISEIRSLTRLPLLGALPVPRRAERGGLVVRDHPSTASAEAYRILRTNVRSIELAGRRSFVLASASDPRDGAMVVANLAWTFAQAGRSVLLVDLDLRNNTVGELLGAGGAPGVSDVLAGDRSVDSVALASTHPDLKFILSGTAQASPSDLLSGPAMTEMLRGLERDHDMVFLHVPPLLSYTDAAVVAAAAGATIVTVSAARTRAVEVETALTTLANVRVSASGLVVTRVRGEALEQGRSRFGRGAASSEPTMRWEHLDEDVVRPKRSVGP